MHSQVFLRRGVLLVVVTTAALAALLPAPVPVGEPKPAAAPLIRQLERGERISGVVDRTQGY